MIDLTDVIRFLLDQASEADLASVERYVAARRRAADNRRQREGVRNTRTRAFLDLQGDPYRE